MPGRQSKSTPDSTASQDATAIVLMQQKLGGAIEPYDPVFAVLAHLALERAQVMLIVILRQAHQPHWISALGTRRLEIRWKFRQSGSVVKLRHGRLRSPNGGLQIALSP